MSSLNASLPIEAAEPDSSAGWFTPGSGVFCLTLIARLHGISVDPDHLAHMHQLQQDASPESLQLAARHMGLQVKAVQVKLQRLASTPLPAIGVCTDANGQTGYFILARVDEQGYALVQRAGVGQPERISLQALANHWRGELLLLASRAASVVEWSRFDFTWFIPAVVKYRRLLAEVLLVSLALQVFALVTPLFFQVVMDKVLVHNGLSTLNVVAIGLAGIVSFEVVLTGLRTYVFSHTTSRIDVELGARLFRHLLALPAAYFSVRRVGDSVARVRELENIRQFLTGQGLTVVLDVLFSIIFLAVMWMYSPLLTGVVALSLPFYAVLSWSITPVLRARLHEQYNRSAENQAFLVETVSGIDTVKAMAVEPHWVRQWEKQLAAYVSAGFRTVQSGIWLNGGVSLISKVVTVSTLYWGAKAVIDHEMTVGQLVAFNMLAGQVAQPVMRLAQLWTDFQQVGVSMQRLADVLDNRTEVQSSRTSLPPVRGRITFEGVHFQYRPDGKAVLTALDLDIQPGEVLGIVGQSGSGKSTLTRLVQRLYTPTQGRVLVDGLDLAVIEPASLRRQVGVVLQENLLFNRSIRDNIALAEPGAPLAVVMRAAQLAGAHDFITDLPEGYDTLVGDHGSTLSGGQRQRIAIARALITQPRILILDEATSALDPETERIVQRNLHDICKGRTVIIVAHRLSAVRQAHRIVVMERGRIVESGTPDALMQRESGHFARLYRAQNRG